MYVCVFVWLINYDVSIADEELQNLSRQLSLNL